MEELKNQYPDDCIILGNIIKRKNNLKEDDIAGAFSLMQDTQYGVSDKPFEEQ